ncbi:MAG: hydroxyacylglutathione hydrolase [Proteobacteria bacterium]|nr:MBL fold metallo-hydrolase [Desulfobacula sp.]MBU3952991.1 hydroxyacylglutathione hydrolase [Pseudomonadota bacterium]MBU4129320.1 hydroxyacylglutathione hydrolase [Pseudomonadota bacterium]
MLIKQFRYSTDNLGYLVFSGNQGIAIDAGNPADIIDFAREHGITVKYVTNTHFHHDHTCGNAVLLETTDAEFIDCRKVKAGQTIVLDDGSLEIIVTPGHTEDSVCFRASDFLVTGDTLFNGTVGNCFSGDLKGFFRSLKRLLAFPPETKIFAGHDYVMESMKVAAAIEEDNPDIAVYLQKYTPRLVVSTLADELRVNPYVRFNAPSMMNRLQKRTMPFKTEEQRFISIMEIF